MPFRRTQDVFEAAYATRVLNKDFDGARQLAAQSAGNMRQYNAVAAVGFDGKTIGAIIGGLHAERLAGRDIIRPVYNRILAECVATFEKSVAALPQKDKPPFALGENPGSKELEDIAWHMQRWSKANDWYNKLSFPEGTRPGGHPSGRHRPGGHTKG